MILNGEKRWHDLAVNQVSALLRGITSKNDGGFHCLICLYSFRIRNKLVLHKIGCENRDCCNVNMPPDDNKILEFIQYQNVIKHHSLFTPIDIIEKIDGCKNNPENSSKTKLSKHIPSAISISAILPWRSIENKHDIYIEREVKVASKMFVNSCENKRAKEQQKSYENAKLVWKKKIENKYLKHKKYRKVRYHCHYTGKYRWATRSICNLKCSVPKKFPIFFHNGFLIMIIFLS